MAAWIVEPGSTAMDNDAANIPTFTNETIDSNPAPGAGDAFWWERVHVIAKIINLGNIVTQTVVNLEVYNAFRGVDKDWTGLTINASGVTSVPDPPPTVTISQQHGEDVVVTVSADGAPTVDGDLTFTVGGVTIVVPLIVQRLSALFMPPEVGIKEELEWLTSVFESSDGTEKRQAMRRRPRQMFEYLIRRADGPERQRMENFLFAQTGKEIGLPLWTEATRLTSAVTASDTTLNVTSTQYADYRAGGNAMIWTEENQFEIVNVTAVPNTTQLTLTNGTVGAFPSGSLVMPLRTALLRGVVPGRRQHIGEAEYRLRLSVTDNDVEIASTAAFNTYNSKVLLDDFNKGDESAESYTRRVVVIDGKTGISRSYTPAANSKRVARKQWITDTPQELWEVRQLLHALRGQQVSFYLATWAKEFTPTAALLTAGNTMEVANTGYTQLVNAAQPRNVLRVNLNDGTSIIRGISSAAEIDSDTEELTVDSNWGQDVALADIDFVDVIEKARFGRDKITIEHADIPGQARITAATKGVLE